MTIEIMDKQTILVSLCREDMHTYALCFDDDKAGYPEQGLKRLLYHVGEVCGLDHRGKSYLIEALPSTSGCLLIISVHPVKRKKKYRIKRRVTQEICVFFDADAMLDYWRAEDQGEGCSVYLFKGRYVLLPSPSAPERSTSRLSEYGEIYPVSAAVGARVREHGRLLVQKHIQRRHIGGRAVGVRDAAAGDGGG